jgi:ABC-type phosphate/phosphonate transport system substrate-binding protein
MSSTLTLGAVAYDPKVVTIWDGFQQWFRARDLDFDYVLYTSYERQVAGHFRGEFTVAWNSPLAWLQTERVAARLGRAARAVAMRDTDQDLTSVVVVRADSPVTSVEQLRGRAVAVGAADSPQATLLPLDHLAAAGLAPDVDFAVRRFDLLAGKHGDHVGGERDAARALAAGEVDAACLIDGNHLSFSRDGTLAPGATRVLAQTAPYDHCCFTALAGDDDALVDRFTALLLGQRHADPAVRPLMDLEGLREWRPGRTGGFAPLDRAIRRFGTVDAFVDGVVAGHARR